VGRLTLTVSSRRLRFQRREEDVAGHQKGDDIPLDLWAVNESDTAAQLSAASSPIAADVSLSHGSLPVSLGTRKLVDLGPSRPHLVLRHINTQVRGAEFVPVTITFGDETRVQMMVEAIDVKGPDERRRRRS